jgi:hypothetical protein
MDVPPTWRRLLDDYFAIALIVCLVVTAVGGMLLADAYVTPPETTERERVVASWETVGRYDYGAEVTEPNPVFDRGTRLSNRSRFFRAVSPTLDGQFRFGYEASDDGSLDVTLRRATVVESVAEAEAGAGRRTVWRVVSNETRVERSGVDPGETVAVPFRVNVNRTDNRTERIRERLGASIGEPRLAVRANVTLSGTVNGREVDRTLTYDLPVRTGGGTYEVNDSAALVRTEYERTETVTVERSSSGSGGPLGAAIFLVGATATVALATARARGDIRVDETERERLEFEATREEYDDWISTVALPGSVVDRPRARAASLGDLVDVAIDTDERVLEDPDDGTLYVPREGTLYVYEPPTADRPASEPAPPGPEPGASGARPSVERGTTDAADVGDRVGAAASRDEGLRVHDAGSRESPGASGTGSGSTRTDEWATRGEQSAAAGRVRADAAGRPTGVDDGGGRGDSNGPTDPGTDPHEQPTDASGDDDATAVDSPDEPTRSDGSDHDAPGMVPSNAPGVPPWPGERRDGAETGAGPGVGEDGTAAGEDGTAAGEDGTAAGEDGTAAGEDGTAAGEDGTAAGEDARGDDPGGFELSVESADATDGRDASEPVPDRDPGGRSPETTKWGAGGGDGGDAEGDGSDAEGDGDDADEQDDGIAGGLLEEFRTEPLEGITSGDPGDREGADGSLFGRFAAGLRARLPVDGSGTGRSTDEEGPDG